METSSKPDKYIPCFLCFNSCPIKYSKRNKPYFICDHCGIQTFIRRDKGIELFNRLIQFIQGNSGISTNSGLNRPESIWLINQLITLQGKLKQIQGEQEKLNLFESNSGLEASEKLIKKEIRVIEEKIEGLFKQI